MDILKYMNSRDVADYLEETGFEFNAMQAAYVVYINDWLTIGERIGLWREIIDAVPDCEYERIFNGFISVVPSAHAIIESHIDEVQGCLRNFSASDKSLREAMAGDAAVDRDRWTHIVINQRLFESFRNELEFFVPRIPIPFIRGDILVDATQALEPFVYDRCTTWSTEEGHALTLGDREVCVLANDDDFDDAFMDRCGNCSSDFLSKRNGHMKAFGYEVIEGDSGSLLRYSEFGACDNYLNLEYYRGSFDDGRLAVLPIVSWFVMNETRDEVSCDARWKRKYAAEERFAARGLNRLDCGAYDICSLVNAGLRFR